MRWEDGDALHATDAREGGLHALALTQQSQYVTHFQELATELDMSPASVRRHLDSLRTDHLVDARPVRHAVGRPSYAYFATEAAEEMTPAHYSRLLSRIFSQMMELGEKEVSGVDGPALLERVFVGVAQEVAQEHRPEVTGNTLEERVAQTSRALSGEGILDSWQHDDEGFRLINSACPYRRAAMATTDACHSDHLAIQSLLGTPVEQVGTLARGQTCCEYIVRTAGRKTDAGEIEERTAPA